MVILFSFIILLFQVLLTLDKCRLCSNLMIMAATNRPFDLDPSLRRSGRFETEVRSFSLKGLSLTFLSSYIFFFFNFFSSRNSFFFLLPLLFSSFLLKASVSVPFLFIFMSNLRIKNRKIIIMI